MLPRRFVPGIAAAVASALLLAESAAAQPAALQGFEESVAKAVQEWRVPGLAVAVVQDGKVVVSRGYGVREPGKPAAVDTHTLFAIGSTTKAMTAALIGMLVDEKKLAWDDPVVKHLPWFQLNDPYLTREITVRDLLTHRAGLGNADYLWYGQETIRARSCGACDSSRRRIRCARSFIYQNVMYAAAGAVIEAVTRQPWEQMIKTRIFDPLGMSETIATPATLARQPNVAMPHDIIGGHVRVIENASVDRRGARRQRVVERRRHGEVDAMLLLESGTRRRSACC